jgi:hypothetical protein
LWGHLAELTKVLVNIPLLTNSESSHLDEWQREKAQKILCQFVARRLQLLVAYRERLSDN